MNERTLARTFKRETGMTHGAWCRHARLLLSLPRLAAGTPILELALEHGYDSPARSRRSAGTRRAAERIFRGAEPPCPFRDDHSLTCARGTAGRSLQ